MAGMRSDGVLAVFDVGKTNIKLSAVDAGGRVLETLSLANPVREGPPWRHHDLAAIRAWLFDGLGALARRHALAGSCRWGTAPAASWCGTIPTWAATERPCR